MDRPLIVGHVYNLSLEGYSDEQPQLVAQFPCQIEVNTCLYITIPLYKIHLKTCCSTIWLHNVSLFAIKKITITLKTPNATGLVLHKVVNATIEQIEVYLITESITRSQQGIVLMDCHFIQMHSIIARNWWSGLLFTNSNNIHIHKVIASNNDGMGIFTLHTSNFHLYSSSFTNNTMLCGIGMYAGYNIVINNTTSVCNAEGINFRHIDTAQITKTFVSNITGTGMFLFHSININISNTTLTHNEGDGLMIYSSSSVHIDGITVKHNELQSKIYNGIYVFFGYSIIINNTISMYHQFGIVFLNVSASQIENTIASNNTYWGICLFKNKNINISNTTVSHNVDRGLSIDFSNSIHIDGIPINSGIYLFQTKWIYISGFTAVNKYSVSNYAQIIVIRDSQYITIYDTIITVNTSVVSSGELISQPAVINLHNSTLNLSRCTFIGNRITGIKAISSNITLSGNLTFSNNSAYTGSAFILVDNSILILIVRCILLTTMPQILEECFLFPTLRRLKIILIVLRHSLP